MSTPNGGTVDFDNRKGLWRWRGYYIELETGKRKRKYLYADNRAKLREKVELYLADLDNGEFGKEMTVKTWFHRWLDTVIAETVKVRSREVYEQVLKSHLLPKFGNVKLGDFNAQSFQAHLNELTSTLSPVTVGKVRSYTIMLFDAAIRFGYIAFNPVRATRPPKVEKKLITALSREQTEAIIAEARSGEYQDARPDDEGAAFLKECSHALLVTAIDTGLRKGELFGLTWSNIDFNRGSLTVSRSLTVSSVKGKFLTSPKTNSSARSVVLPERTIEVLREWQSTQKAFAKKFLGFYNNSQNLVFTNSRGHFVDGQNFQHRCFDRIIEHLNLGGIRFHDLRHAHASQLIAAGVHVNVVKERLGHSSLDVTLKVYAHLLPNQQEAARDEINKIFN